MKLYYDKITGQIKQCQIGDIDIVVNQDYECLEIDNPIRIHEWTVDVNSKKLIQNPYTGPNSLAELRAQIHKLD